MPSNDPDRTFDRDVDAFLRQLPALVKQHEGAFALIRAAEVVSIHPSEDEALSAGYGRYGPSAFLVKQILRSELTLLEQSRQSCPS